MKTIIAMGFNFVDMKKVIGQLNLKPVKVTDKLFGFCNFKILVIFKNNNMYLKNTLPNIFYTGFNPVGIKLSGFKTNLRYTHEVLNCGVLLEKIQEHL